MKKAIIIATFGRMGSQVSTTSGSLNTWRAGGEQEEIEVEFESPIPRKATDEVLAVQAFWRTFNTEHYAGNCAYNSINLRVKEGSIKSIHQL